MVTQIDPGAFKLIDEARRLVGAPTGIQRCSSVKECPATLSPGALDLLKETLAKGCAFHLLVRGGWRQKLVIRDGVSSRTRLWERELPPLRFSPAAFELCRLAAGAQNTSSVPLDSGDEVLAYLICEAISRQRSSCNSALLARSPLAWIGFPSLLAGLASIRTDDGFDELVGPRAFLLEALNDELADRWLEVELSKRSIKDAEALRQLGTVQDGVLCALLTQIETKKRYDLSTFLIKAMSRLLDPSHTAAEEVERLRPVLHSSLALSERQRAYRASASTFRALGRLSTWYEEARRTPFFEETYRIAQVILEQWEDFGQRGFAHVAAVAREYESIGGNN